MNVESEIQDMFYICEIFPCATAMKSTVLLHFKHWFLTFQYSVDLLGDDIMDFKIKRKDPNKRLDKLTKRAKLRQKIDDEITEEETKVVVKQIKQDVVDEPPVKNTNVCFFL